MEWLPNLLPVIAIGAGVIAVCLVIVWLARCRHPNPHFQRPVLLRDPVTGSDEVVEPASYTCYECGKSWPAVMRDAAWAPTGIRQSYRGYDAALAERASTRAAIVSEQRQLLAANRTGPTRAPAAVAAPKRRGRRKAWAAAANVTDINTRRPA